MMSKLHPLFANYKHKYLSFTNSLIQTQLISLVSSHFFHDFQTQTEESVDKLMTEFQKALMEALDKTSEETTVETRVTRKKLLNLQSDEYEYSLAFGTLLLILNSFCDPYNTNKTPVSLSELGQHFCQLARYQALVMVFAHLDAFIDDTLRVACHARPQILKNREKQVTWEKVLQFQNMEDLIEYFTEELVYEFGHQSVDGQINSLKEKPLKLKLTISNEELKFLRVLEKRRNLIVHNGGVVTQRYIEETNDTNVKVGQVVEVSDQELDELFAIAHRLGSDLFLAVSIKFLGADDMTLTAVPLYTDKKWHLEHNGRAKS